MNNKRFLGSWTFRSKLLILLLVIFFPAFGIMVTSGLSQRHESVVKAQHKVLLLVRSLTAQQERVAIATKTMLSTLALLPEVRNLEAPACDRIFREVQQQYPFYTVITASYPDGRIFAASAPFDPAVNLADQKYFRDAVSSADFAAGEYLVGKIIKVHSLNYAYPVLNANKKLVAVLCAGFNLDEFGRFIATASLPQGSEVIFTDHQGLRLYCFPKDENCLLGKPVEKGLFARLSGSAAEGLAEHGAARIGAFEQLRLKKNSPPYMYMFVGLPKDTILHAANLEMLQNLSLFGFVALLALILGWILANVEVIKPIGRLVAAAQQFGQGEMNTRTGLPHSADELGRLAQSFDDMACLLEKRNRQREEAEQALGQAYAELETRVKERTADLSVSNWALQLEITERKQAEAALRESEEKYRVLIETTNTGYVIVDPEGRVLDANPQYVRLTGHQELGEILGRSVLEWTAPHDREKNAASIKQFLQTGLEKNLELDYAWKNGRSIPVEISATAINSSEGIKFLSLVRDISDRKQAEAEKAKLEAILMQAQKMEAIGTLAGGIAHDFNNILTAIMGNISLAEMDLSLGDRSRQRLAEAGRASLQAQNLSRQLLTFSKGGAPIKETVAIDQLVSESASFACRGSQVSYESSLPEDLWAGEADPGQLSQVFQNLIINAVQAMPAGGTIKISGENLVVGAENEWSLGPGRYVKVSIEDAGLGIPPEHLPRIFDPYFTTKQVGSGLGLATSYSIIKNHHGHITVTSELGKGAIFSVFLSASEQQIIPAPKEEEMVFAGRGKILVMDDEELVRQLLKDMLTHLGYEANIAGSGNEALELFIRARDSGQPFAGVILDLTVPGGMGGQETMEELLKLDSRVKGIVSSGYSEAPVMANFKEFGFTGVIAKPYKIAELSKVLKEVLA